MPENSKANSKHIFLIVTGTFSVAFPLITGLMILSHATNPNASGFDGGDAFIIKIIDYCLVPLPILNLFVFQKWGEGEGFLGFILNAMSIGVNLVASFIQVILFMYYVF